MDATTKTYFEKLDKSKDLKNFKMQMREKIQKDRE